MRPDDRYGQRRDDDWYVADSRVEAYSVIAAWQQGFSPDEVQESYPVLSLAEVYGAILYYLEHREILDAFFGAMDARYRANKAESEARDPAFHAMMRRRFADFRAARGSAASWGLMGGHGSSGQPPRFVTDVNFSRRIVVGLRRQQPGVDVVKAQDAVPRDTPDPANCSWPRSARIASSSRMT